MGKIKTVILCGGKSSRMGADKATLSIGGRTFLEHLVQEFAGDGEKILLSVGDKGRYEDLLQEMHSQVTFVEDQYKDCGPLGGLHAICKELCDCSHGQVLQDDEEIQNAVRGFWVTTVDLPLADQGLKDELESYFSEGIDAVIPVEEDGRLHPLCAVYRTSMMDKIEKHLQAGNYRVQSLLRELRVCYVPVQKLTGGSRKLRNVNTPEDYQALLRLRTLQMNSGAVKTNRWGIPIVSLAAYSGSGKTSFLEKLIAEFTERGIRTAVLKHDVHGFSIDREGKDTFRFAKAGADPVMICSDSQAARMDYHEVSPLALLDAIKEVDLILVEGFKRGSFPKILLFREAAGQPAAMDFTKEQPILVVSDRKEWPEVNCPVLTLEEIGEAADFITGQILCMQEHKIS